MAITVTARQIVDEARTQDARFFSVNVPDGALLLTLNTTQRNLLLQYGSSVEGLLDQASQVAAQVNGALVGVDSGGAPHYITTQGDGYPVLNAGTVSAPIPYVDFTQQPISLDPFGLLGGTPGFPLPPDLIKLVMVVAAFCDGTTADIDVIPERSRNYTNTHNPTAFLNGNRLVPVHTGSPPLSGIYQDVWASIASVAVSFIGMTTLSDLDAPITIPTVLHAALIAAVAFLLARTTPECTSADRATYAEMAAQTGQAIALAGIDLLGDVMQNSILYRE